MQKFNKLFLFFAALFLTTSALTAQVFFTEDFADAIPADWTAVEAQGNGQAFSNWEHSTTGPSGAFAIPAIASTTADNGWMIFDGDANCNYDGQDAWLISPAIDCSDKAIVYLIAESYYRKYQDSPSIMVGTDLNNLASWNQIPIYENVAVNAYGGVDVDDNPSELAVDLSEFAANTAGVHFAFRFTGACDYSWQIDDVTLTDEDPTPANDLRVNPFFAVAQNAVWPASQVEPVYFLADVENVGSADQTNAILTATVQKDGSEVFSTTFDYGTIMSDSLVENMLFAESYTPDGVGTYDVTYSLASDDVNDSDPENNTQAYTFIVNDSTYSKDLGNFFATRPADGSWDAGEPHAWAYGNHYHVVSGVDQYARTATFVVGDGSTVGEAFVISLYEWVDTNGDTACDPDERVRVGFLLYTVTGSESESTPIVLPISSFAGNDLELKDNADYVLIMEYTPSDVGVDIECGFSSEVDYGAMSFLHAGGILDPAQLREGSLLTIASTIDDATYGLNTFGSDFVPVMRLSIGESSLIPSDVTQTLPTNDKVEVTPNPAVDEAILNLDLEVVSSSVRVTIFDISGRKMSVQMLENVQNQQVTLDVSTIPAGIYMVNVITDKGFATRQLVVMK